MSDSTITELWKWLREHQRMEHEHQESVNERLTKIEDTLAQAKGGWKTLIVVGTIVSAIGAGMAWIWTNVFHGKTPQ